jgi:hypothetical protein
MLAQYQPREKFQKRAPERATRRKYENEVKEKSNETGKDC